MTENEAIRELEEYITENDKLTISFEAITLARKALEKEIPQNVYHFIDDDTFETSCCGTDISNSDYKYCPECGQLLGEVEEIADND